MYLCSVLGDYINSPSMGGINSSRQLTRALGTSACAQSYWAHKSCWSWRWKWGDSTWGFKCPKWCVNMLANEDSELNVSYRWTWQFLILFITWHGDFMVISRDFDDVGGFDWRWGVASSYGYIIHVKTEHDENPQQSATFNLDLLCVL